MESITHYGDSYLWKYKTKILLHSSYLFIAFYLPKERQHDKHKFWNPRKLDLNPSFMANLHVIWDKLLKLHESLFCHLTWGKWYFLLGLFYKDVIPHTVYDACVHARLLSCFSRVRLLVTLWTVAYQAPLSMGILQVIILEWVAMPSSRESSQSRDQTYVSCISCIGRLVLYP